MFCILSYSILESVPISIPEFADVKRVLLLIGGLYLFTQCRLILRNLKKRGYLIVFVLVVLFALSIIFPAVLNLNYTSHYLTINLIVYLLELFAFMMCAAEKEHCESVFKFLFWYALLLAIVTDILMFSKIVTFESGFFETYLIGTKFAVSYLHIYLFAFFLMKKKSRSFLTARNIIFLIVFTSGMFFIKQRIDCNTGLIGYILLILLMFVFNMVSETALRKLSSYSCLLIVLIGCTLFAFAAEAILSIPSIENFIVNGLHRDATLTGRTAIYGAYAEMMQGHWLWGYGYTNTFNIAMSLFNYANAQNGLLQWILQIGVVPVSIMLIIFVVIFKQMSRKKHLKQIIPVISLVYVYALLGTVEVTISMNFFLWMALIFLWSHQETEEQI